MKHNLGKDWIIIEGTIANFQWTSGNENLLEKISHHASAKSAVTGVAAAAVGMYGTVATSSMVASYDGEYTENFVCTLGEHVISGSFCGARKLKNGDRIKAIVTKQENGVNVAVAIQRPQDELVWLPTLAFRGNFATLKNTVKSSINDAVFAWALFAIMAIGYMFFGDLSLIHALAFMLITAIFFPLLVFAIQFLPGRIGKEYGEIGSEIFRKFGFPDPDNLDMQMAGLHFQTDEENVKNVYKYRLALDAHANGTKIITRFDRNIGRYKAEAARRKAQKRKLKKAR